MTFCGKTKQEIASIELEDCCNASRLYGMLSFAKSFSKDRIMISSMDKQVILCAGTCLQRFGIHPDKIEYAINGRTKTLLINDRLVTDRILSDFGYSGDEPNYRLLSQNFRCEKCKPAFFSGSFMSGGNITEPARNYRLEFSTHRYAYYTDFSLLLNSAGFHPKLSERKSLKRVIYFKDSEQIEDFLVYIGAQNAAMEVMNEKIYKGVINRVNRQTNCENANIDKIVKASEADRIKIARIFSSAGEESLSGDLREIAMLRVDNPELSLAEIGKLIQPNLSKSGVNHRLNRIRAIANEIMGYSHDEHG